MIYYIFCEPCSMCLSAIIWSHIKEAYFTYDRKDATNIGFCDDDIYEFINDNNNLISQKQLDRKYCIDVMKIYTNNDGIIY